MPTAVILTFFVLAIFPFIIVVAFRHTMVLHKQKGVLDDLEKLQALNLDIVKRLGRRGRDTSGG